MGATAHLGERLQRSEGKRTRDAPAKSVAAADVVDVLMGSAGVDVCALAGGRRLSSARQRGRTEVKERRGERPRGKPGSAHLDESTVKAAWICSARARCRSGTRSSDADVTLMGGKRLHRYQSASD